MCYFSHFQQLNTLVPQKKKKSKEMDQMKIKWIYVRRSEVNKQKAIHYKKKVFTVNVSFLKRFSGHLETGAAGRSKSEAVHMLRTWIPASTIPFWFVLLHASPKIAYASDLKLQTKKFILNLKDNLCSSRLDLSPVEAQQSRLGL